MLTYYTAIIIFFTAVLNYSGDNIYLCYPCGSDCDLKGYNAPGTCSHCGMELIARSRIKFNNVQPEDVCTIISANKDVILLDVRTAEEYQSKGDKPLNSYGHLKNAINISSVEIKNRLGELEQYKEKEIVVYCARGHRSAVISQYLTDNGFSNVKNMTGGMELWDSKSKDMLTCKEDTTEK